MSYFPRSAEVNDVKQTTKDLNPELSALHFEGQVSMGFMGISLAWRPGVALAITADNFGKSLDLLHLSLGHFSGYSWS